MQRRIPSFPTYFITSDEFAEGCKQVLIAEQQQYPLTAAGKTDGKFKPGQSGNPTGRPKIAKEIAEMARMHCPEALERLVYWMRMDDPKHSVAAANAILNRGCGMPMQATEISGPEGAELSMPSISITFNSTPPKPGYDIDQTLEHEPKQLTEQAD